MTIDDFTVRRRPVWYELEGAINRANSGVGGMASSDLERFGVLYRHAASDLAIANRDFPTDNVAVYLNSLCSRAHTMLYLGRGGMRLVLLQVADFYRGGLPRLFRASWRYMVAALALLLLGAVACRGAASRSGSEPRPEFAVRSDGPWPDRHAAG
jgi:hypothetical protein